MKNSPSNRAAAIEELHKGREFIAQLGALVRKSWTGRDCSAAGGLIDGVMSSLSRALDVLEADKSTTTDSSRPVGDEDGSDQACGKKRKNTAAGRGGFRRRRQSSQWKTVISKETMDQYSWRKYGQKEIHSSKFPRSYFRCTHKYDQGCQATKQVQKSEEDPSMFLITYMGEHTCKRLNILPNLIIPCNSSELSIISFGSNASNLTQEFPLPSSPLFSQKQEGDEEVLSNPNPSTPSSEFFDLLNIYDGSLLEPMIEESASDHGHKASGLQSGLEMSFTLDDLFDFDQGDLFRDLK